MNPSVASALIAISVSFALTPVFRTLGRRLGLLDHPNERSSHVTPTPRNGGKAILLGIIAAAIAGSLFVEPLLLRIAAGVALLAVTGLVDDARPLSPLLKLALQVVAAVLVVAGIGFHPLLLMLSVIWITGVTNAFNFMDGLNGIASLEAIVCGLTMGWLLLAAGDVMGSALCFAAAGGAAGFYPWNVTGSIFMGDVGSLPLGFLFGAMVVRCAESGVDPIRAALPLLPFVLDTGVTLVRRAIRRERVFRAHRIHYYQRLTTVGWSHAAVSSLWALLAAAGAAMALLWFEVDFRAAGLLALFAVHGAVFAWIDRRAPLVRRDG